ncbi:MAG: hypothetical protein MMC33_003165 [Icmadophila ericetorum]|nr:hypothetical protein [Icmadophila ericetorum]
MADPSPATTVHLIIRFTASLSDLPLTILIPQEVTAVALKQQIRTHLPPNLSSNTLRLIHSGKVLPDKTLLSTSLRLPPPPPPSTSIKGKTPIYPPQTLYIHCSISEDPLSAEELAAEAALAASTTASKEGNATGSTSNVAENGAPTSPTSPMTTTIPAPRGFDRLLTAGFTPAEIASLRSQFLAIQAHTHTPDTMPSAAELRTLEDQWIDNNNTTTGEGVLEGGDDAESGGLDDMLWGNVMGFFWPVGALVWLLREDGVWSKRRQIAVVTGVLVNVAFSVLRVTS